jgi:hypothetical protein
MFRSKFTFLSATLLILLGCETPQDNNVEKARSCLNKAAQLATVQPSAAASQALNTCEPLIANVNNAEAGRLGVGIVLVEEQKLANLTSIETAVSNGTSAITTSISYMTFSSQNQVGKLINFAGISQSAGVTELADIISLAYYVQAAAIAAGGSLSPTSTPAQVSTDLTNLSTDPTNGPAAAQALVSAQQNACAGSGSSSTLCTDLTKAVGSNTSSYTAILQNAAAYVGSGG